MNMKILFPVLKQAHRKGSKHLITHVGTWWHGRPQHAEHIQRANWGMSQALEPIPECDVLEVPDYSTTWKTPKRIKSPRRAKKVSKAPELDSIPECKEVHEFVFENAASKYVDGMTEDLPEQAAQMEAMLEYHRFLEELNEDCRP